MATSHRSSGAQRDAATLVAARARILQRLRRHASWADIEARIAAHLHAQFLANPPTLRRIDAQTPAAILAQIVRYEAVHTVRGLLDLQRRLKDDRRCYALFSAALPDQPLVFIELAFTHGICGDVTALLDTQSPVIDPAACDCAMFYSISSCHEGLRGIPFGNMLIRLVVERLQQEMPWLTTFATVSPVPGFRPWMTELAQRDGGALLDAVAALDERDWALDAEESRCLEQTLIPLCAAYLLYAKRGTEPLDPVARFHLGNGARLERINWLGDTSDAGLTRSAGIVANYLYDVPSLDANREAYLATHAVIAAPALTNATVRLAS